MDKKGQAILSEYVMIFFVVVAAATSMTVFVRRSFQARINDETNYMVNRVANSEVCDADCVKATGGKIRNEYEPYYGFMVADTVANNDDYMNSTSGNPKVFGVKYTKSFNEQKKTYAGTVQLPAACTGDAVDKPAFCTAK